MKLKTKFQDEDFDLGEVVEANVYYGGSGRIKVIVEPTKGGMITFYFESLKGLNEMFEDYEEPKRHWIIDTMNDRVEDFDVPMVFNEAIGNYFETKEEAEKAVEKLKAWKRLKDKGISFEVKMTVDRKWCLEPKAEPQQRTFDEAHDLFEDIMFVFGGEE